MPRTCDSRIPVTLKAAQTVAVEATVVITTKDRSEDLRRAIASALAQTVPVEVLVMDDGSTDGTAAMVAEEFPEVRLVRNESSLGYIVQRNRAAELARGSVIFSLDDDAAFSSHRVIEQTLCEFSCNEVGAVAMPFVNVLQSDVVHQQAPDPSRIHITDRFVGTAYAVRRDLFRALGGFRSRLFHQGEEGEFCARLLDAGYVVRLGRADAIHHYESPRRDFRRMDIFGRRNDVLAAWYTVPWPFLPLHLLGTSWNGLRFGVRQQRTARMLHGLLRGYVACIAEWRARRPVRVSTYRLARMLRKRGPLPLDVIRHELVPRSP